MFHFSRLLVHVFHLELSFLLEFLLMMRCGQFLEQIHRNSDQNACSNCASDCDSNNCAGGKTLRSALQRHGDTQRRRGGRERRDSNATRRTRGSSDTRKVPLNPCSIQRSVLRNARKLKTRGRTCAIINLVFPQTFVSSPNQSREFPLQSQTSWW